MTVLTLNIHHKGEHGVPVPRLIQKICFDRLLARVLCIRAFNSDEHQADTTVSILCCFAHTFLVVVSALEALRDALYKCSTYTYLLINIREAAW